MGRTRIGKRRQHIVGDDLDEQYLKGEHDIQSYLTAVIIFVILAIVFWPK